MKDKPFFNLRPAVCLVVSGPGFVHALAGMANSNENAWFVLDLLLIDLI